MRSSHSLWLMRKAGMRGNMSRCKPFILLTIAFRQELHPQGSLTTGQGNRFVLASTQELHEKITELANRVRQLEDGLRASHSQISHEPHPLLSEELLKIKAPLQREAPSHRSQHHEPTKEEENNPDVVDAFGSLSISPVGRTKYYGQIASSWNEDDEPEAESHLTALQSLLPHEILDKASAFPIHPSPTAQEIPMQHLFWYLPTAERTIELKNVYFSHAAMMYNPISPESFDTEIYSQFFLSTDASPTEEPLLSHRLALMFMVLALGSLMDTVNQPPYNLDAEKYNQLARAALFRYSLFDEPTITAVQALFLMSYYLFLADRHGSSSGARWAIMGITVKLSQSIGLHRDSGRWGVDPQETQRRRELFWELYTYDSWQCMTFGRPPSFNLAHVDCKMPYSSEPSDEQSFHAWKHRFSSECMAMLHEQAFGAKTPTYATILQLDRKFRAFPVPPVLQVAGFGSSESRPGGFPQTVMLMLQRHIVLAIRESNLLYLHRSFFARAVSDHPKDPLGSPYGTSVIAAYRSAGSLVALMRNLHTQLKEPSERMWFLWTHMFSCAIVLGSIVTRCPSMSLAPSALVQLDSACELFSKAAPGFHAEKVLHIILGLQAKAHASLEDYRKGKGSPLSRHPTEPLSPVEPDDELDTLGGKTRLVAKKEPMSPPVQPQVLERSPTSHNPVVPLPLSPSAGSALGPQVLEYLRTFGENSTRIPSQDIMMVSEPSSSGPYDDISTYGMSTLQGQYHSEPASYQQSSTSHAIHANHPPSPVHQQHQQHSYQPIITDSNGLQNGGSSVNGLMNTNTFPQYFSVYDYGSGIANQPHSVNGFSPVDKTAGMMKGMMNGHEVNHRRTSGSPEMNRMESTWDDFVGNFIG
ncbi:hypothetical protein EYR40_008957 [Pleurotus pulmonarius]|nr:hypothetical protein EYR36_009780 [Pleurotus pulmonarius]KAF4594154.1 hypothetical protein EYR40_008957 [Pleurotus pulmonarius]